MELCSLRTTTTRISFFVKLLPMVHYDLENKQESMEWKNPISPKQISSKPSAPPRRLWRPFPEIPRMDGWMICDFTSFSTLFHSYQDNGRKIMKGRGQWNPVYG